MRMNEAGNRQPHGADGYRFTFYAPDGREYGILTRDPNLTVTKFEGQPPEQSPPEGPYYVGTGDNEWFEIDTTDRNATIVSTR